MRAGNKKNVVQSQLLLAKGAGVKNKATEVEAEIAYIATEIKAVQKT